MKEQDTIPTGSAGGDRLLNASSAAEMLGLPESSFWAISADPAAALPRAIKIGRRSRWSQRSLERWITEQHHTAQTQKKE